MNVLRPSNEPTRSPRRPSKKTAFGRAGVALLVLVLGVTACRRDRTGPDTEPLSIDPGALHGSNALEEVRAFVALGPRESGTEGARLAAEYLAGRLRAMGIDPLVDTFTDPTPTGPVMFRNVTGVIPGTRPETLILGSHYDTKAGISADFAGANDSGSSTGLLLALAELLQRSAPLPVDVLVVFFDGEECAVRYGPRDGLHGSRRLARTLVQNQRVERTRAVIIMDMVGDRDLSITLPRNATPELISLAFDAARRLGARHQFALARGAILDDHVPFLEAGIPAVNLIDFHFGSRPGRNDYWHTPEDTMDKLSPASLQTVGRIVLRMLNELMRAENTGS